MNFTGGAGTVDGQGAVFEWSDVIVVIENNVIVDYFTQFSGDALPGPGDAVSISGFNVQLTSLSYRHLGGTVGAGTLDIGSGTTFRQAAGGFKVEGKLTNNGSITFAADTTLTGAFENNHLATLENTVVKLAPVDGEFLLSGSGDLRMRGWILTGQGGDSSITDLMNSSRISGHGQIGSAFGLLSYPSDGGYLNLINTAAGTVEADVSGQTLAINTQLTAANEVHNAGLFLASNGGTLLFDGYQGSINGSPLYVRQSGAGTMKAFNGSKVMLDDTVVIGGTLASQGTGVVEVSGFYTRLVDVDIANGSTVNMGRSVALEGTIENRGTIVADGFDSSTVIDADGVTFTGGGTFRMMGNYGYSRIVGEAPGAVLTNGIDHTIAGFGGLLGGNLSFVNRGLVQVLPDAYRADDRENITLDQLASVVNKGVMEATGGTTLALVNLGVLDNKTGTIRAVGTDGKVSLSTVVIDGGTLHTDASSVIRADGNNVTFKDITTTVTTEINVGRGATFQGAILNRGTITLDDFEARMVVHADDVLLSGSGRVLLKDNYGTSAIIGAAPGAVLTNSATHLITGDGFIGGGNLTLANAGVISANADPYDDFDSLVIEGLASFTNVGKLEAVNGATLALRPVGDGTLQNTGGVIRAVGAGSVVDLGDTVISGGKLATFSGGTFTIGRAGWDGRVSQLVSTVDMTLDNGRVLSLMGDISNGGDISFTYRSGVRIAEDTVLSGGGSMFIHVGFEGSWFLANAPGKKLVNVDNTLGGAGEFGAYTGIVLVNQAAGEITANDLGQGLYVKTGNTIRNNGVFSADGGILDIYDRMTGTGHLETRNGGILAVDQGTDQDVWFTGSEASTLYLSRRQSQLGGYDFAISGMDVGDRIKLDIGAPAGVETGFNFAYTAKGALLSVDFFATSGNPAHQIRLEGNYSEGQFVLVGTPDGYWAWERVVTRDGTAGNDAMTAARAGERVIGLDGDDTLVSNIGDDVLDGSRGNDTADFSKALGGVTVTLGTTAAQAVGGGLGNDRLIAIENLIGGARGDSLTGNAGANRLDGRGGVDTMTGLAGNDTYVVERKTDKVIEVAGEGNDTVLSKGTYKLAAAAEIETLSALNTAGTTKVQLTGNAFDQTVIGNAGNNVLKGGGGKDTFRGLDGNDTYYVDSADDTVYEAAGQGTDTIITSSSFTLGAKAEVEILRAAVPTAKTKLELTGNTFAQQITGNDGNNRIEGGGGLDVLTGLGGADTFVLKGKPGGLNLTTITDFDPLLDTIVLTGADFRALALGDLDPSRLTVNTTGLADDKSDRLIYRSDTGELIYDVDGKGGKDGVVFAMIGLGHALDGSEFIVI